MLKSLPLFAAVVIAGGTLHAQSDTTVIHLEGTAISARIARKSQSSLRFSDIPSEEIRSNAPGRTFPELIRNVPGVYSTSETGSFGDAKINIRGFKQENIAVLLNGIPISGLSSGSMYWNNWMGLADATASIQVQKGIGNSMISDNSVGGTINILTTSPQPDASAQAGYYRTSYGANNAFVNINSGELPRGWNFSLMGSYNFGSSYVDRSAIDSWSYLATLTKTFNDRHSLNFTALGSPEKHEQRAARLTWDEVESRGVAYNKSWGWQTLPDGTVAARTLSRNEYFKPYFTLTHSYTSPTTKVFTSIYLTIADGGGYYSESTGRRIASFVFPAGTAQAGQIDWDAAKAYNEAVVPDANGRRAQNIVTDYLAGHTQAGVKSNIVKTWGARAELDAGLHYQFYQTWEKEQITDLLGADYWYEDYEKKSLAGLNGRNPIKTTGDYVRTHNGRQQNYATLYAIGTYKAGTDLRTVLTFGVSLNGTALRRWDLYNYSEADKWSRWTGRAGWSAKAGVLHSFRDRSKIYANAGVYSRVPYANVFFSNGNNEVSRDISNEHNYLAELGYRRVGRSYGFEATGWVAFWQDKTLLSSPYRSLDEDPTRYMVKGLDALHFGLELEAWWRLNRFVKFNGFASVGRWTWQNDVVATIYDPVTMSPLGQVKVYSDGLHVGDAPQTQVGAGVELKAPKGFSLNLNWTWNDRFWADFDPVTRTDPNDRRDSYRIPAYHLVNASMNWTGELWGQTLNLFVNANNLGNALYVERSKDGANHDRAGFTGYWGNRRNFSFGVRIGILHK